MTGGSGGERYRTGLYAGLFGLAAVLGCFGPLGLALLAAVGGVLAAPFAARRAWPPPAVWALGALAAWATVSLAWSPHLATLRQGGFAFEQFTAAKLWLMLGVYGLLVAGAARLSGHAAARAIWVLGVAAAVWAAILAGDGLGGGGIWATLSGVVGAAPTTQFLEKKAAEGAYVLAVLAWPAVAFLWSRGWRAPALLIPAGVAIGAAGLSAWSAAAGLLAGGAALLLAGRGGRAGVAVLGAVLVAALILAPWLVLWADRSGVAAAAQGGLPASWAHRVEIWTFTAERIAERPLLGWGLDASRTFGVAIPLHPHAAPLQLWLELGLLGVAVAAAFWGLLARRIASARAPGSAAAAAAAYFTVGALSFGVWQEWWLAVGAIAWCACALQATVSTADADERQRAGLQTL